MEELEQAIALLLEECDRLIAVCQKETMNFHVPPNPIAEPTSVLINTRKFAQALKGLKPIISMQGYPVLKCYYLEVSGSKLIVRASDLANYAETQIQIARQGANCSICIPALHFKWFYEFIEKIPASLISLHFDREVLELKYDQSCYQFKGIEGKEFPKLELETIPIAKATVNKSAFVNKFKTVLPCVSRDTAKYVLTGIHLLRQGDDLRFETCDGHRLAIDWMPAEITGELDAIVSRDLIDAISKFETSDTLTLEVYKDFCKLRLGEVTVYSRLVEGTYPAVEKLVVDPKNFVKFDPKEMAKKVKAIKAIGKSIKKGRRASKTFTWVSVGNNELIIKGSNDQGEVVSTIPATLPRGINKEKSYAQLDSQYLLSLLEKMGKQGSIALSPKSPVVMRSEFDTYFLLMPTQTRG